MTPAWKTISAFILSAFAASSIAVAQPAPEPKRFALLIGVDQYAQPGGDVVGVSNLRGPANDVAQMKSLLIDKYGFGKGGDIVTLIGKQATVSAIESNFKQQLLENAKKHPGAAIVFYFSGHGSQTKDKNGDEGDGVDETILAHDSRVGKGDISDDTIETWLQALAPHTRNVTVIFDSCHSGDATRDVSITARSVPPDPATDPNGVVPITSKGAGEPDGWFRGRNGYAFISGSRAGELSHEGMILEADNRGHYRGFMTHYLVTALRLDPSLTYENATRRIGPDVALHAPTQHPQAQGDATTRFLAAAGVQERPYLKISKVIDASRIVVDAGAIHGIGPGAMLAVYGANVSKLVGETGKKANARVSKTSMSTSEVELLDKPAQAVTIHDKVALVTPARARYRMPVLTAALGSNTNTAFDGKVLAGVRTLLQDDRLVEQAPANVAAYAIHRGCMQGAIFRASTRPAAQPAAGCQPVYYVAPRDNWEKPLGGAIIDAQEPAKIARGLASVISLKARQDNLRLIKNEQSPLKGAVKIALIKTAQVAGKAVETVYPATATPRLAVGDTYQFEVANNTDQDLYAAVLVLGSSGQTYLFGHSANGELIKRKTTVRVKPGYTAGKPYGLETYKLFASTRPDVDYGVLVSLGTKKTVGKSAFDMLLSDYSNATTRDPAGPTGVNLDQWVTHSIDTEITP